MMNKETTPSKKSGLYIGLLCYVLWGILPAYWNLLGGVNPLLILCARILFAFIFMLCLMAIMGQMQMFWDTLRDKRKMMYLIPCALLISFNWGLFIYAVNTGRIIDTSIGYYMNPLMSFLLGVIVLKEKSSKMQLVAVGLAFTGVLISIIAYGRIPLISISLALSFAIYGLLKKKAHVDPNASITIESMLIAPFAMLFALIFMTDSIREVGTLEVLLLVGGGIATAVPLVLYSRAVNNIPFITVGFLQYIAPSLSLIYGLIIGIRPTGSQIISFIFVGMGLIVFSIALVRIAKKERELG